MATKMLSELLLGFGTFSQQIVVPWSQFKGTADTDGSTSQLKDTELNVYAEDYFNDDFWVYITDGGAGGGGAGDIRNIANFIKVGGIVEPDISFSGIPKDGATYQIWKCHVQDVIDALNDALVSIYNKLYRKIVFEDMGHSLLTSNAASGQKDVIVSDGTLFFVGQEITIKDDNASEKATIASIASNTLTMEDNLTNAYTTAASAEVFAQSGKYFNVGATLGNNRITGVFLRADSSSQRKAYTEWKVIEDATNGKQIYFPVAVSVDDQTWIIEAMGRLESVVAATPTGTVTIDDERANLLYAETAYHFYNRQSDEVSAGDYGRLRALAERYLRMVNMDLKNLWMTKPRELMSLKTDSDYD